MICSKILRNVIAWEHEYKMSGTYRQTDYYTLHFKQWWKSAMEIKYQRSVTDINSETGEYKHTMTEPSANFYDQLTNHINDTYKDDTDVSPKKCKVLQLVPKETKETEE